MAVGAMLASLTTTNPGGEPRNEEARSHPAQLARSAADSAPMVVAVRGVIAASHGQFVAAPSTTPQARRQLIFFCNSLHNRDLRRPPPVTAMRSLTSFTPYFAEDVTYALEELHGELNDNVDLLHLLQSIFPDECANATALHPLVPQPPFLAPPCIPPSLHALASPFALPCTPSSLNAHGCSPLVLANSKRPGHTLTHPHTPSRALTHTLTHPHTPSHTHTHSHTFTHTHTPSHTRAPP